MQAWEGGTALPARPYFWHLVRQENTLGVTSATRLQQPAALVIPWAVSPGGNMHPFLYSEGICLRALLHIPEPTASPGGGRAHKKAQRLLHVKCFYFWFALNVILRLLDSSSSFSYFFFQA